MLLRSEIRLGCKLYHDDKDGQKYDGIYVRYSKIIEQNRHKFFDDTTSLDSSIVNRLIEFANKWKSRMQTGPQELLPALQVTLPSLSVLRNENICSLDYEEIIIPDMSVNELIEVICTHYPRNSGMELPKFIEKPPVHWKDYLKNAEHNSGVNVRQLIEVCFDVLSGCGASRYAYTGTSKILHIIYPELFVMWDDKIRDKYADVFCKGSLKSGYDYAALFLPEMQRLAKCAISQVRDAQKEQISSLDTIEELKSHLHDSAFKSLKNRDYSPGLAKVLDEYNFMKYTRNHPKLAD